MQKDLKSFKVIINETIKLIKTLVTIFFLNLAVDAECRGTTSTRF